MGIIGILVYFLNGALSRDCPVIGSMVTRRADGGDNAEPQNPRGSLYANDIYLRSTGKWASQVGAISTTVVTAGASSCSAYGCSSYVACPSGYHVTGGGHVFQGDYGCAEKFRFVIASNPAGEGWAVTMACAYATVYAICAQ